MAFTNNTRWTRSRSSSIVWPAPAPSAIMPHAFTYSLTISLLLMLIIIDSCPIYFILFPVFSWVSNYNFIIIWQHHLLDFSTNILEIQLLLWSWPIVGLFRSFFLLRLLIIDICFHYIPELLIIKLWKINISPGIEQVISKIAHNLVLILDILDFVVVETVPCVVILCKGCVVTGLKLALMVRDTKKIVDQRLLILLTLAYDVVIHVKAL